MKTVAVFFGGHSNEREISVITGVYAVNLLRSAGYRVIPVWLDESNRMVLCEEIRSVDEFRDFENIEGKKRREVRFAIGGLCSEKKPKKILELNCALNCCHGGLGEGGGLSALLEWYGIPSASPHMAESAIFMDKALTKIALKGIDVPVVPFVTVREEKWKQEHMPILEEIERTLGYPVIVKPSKLGSSIGVTVARDRAELLNALNFSFRLDGVALIEKYIVGKRDLNCAAYRRNGRVELSEIEEVFSGEPILTFSEKYETVGDRTSQQPAAISEEETAQIKENLRMIYDAFAILGIVRADFLMDGEKVYLNELNTVPGTLATYLFGESLTSAKNLLCDLIEEAISCGVEEKEIVSSGILSRRSYGGKSAKRRENNG